MARKKEVEIQQLHCTGIEQSWRGSKAVPVVPRLRKYGEYGSLWAARTRVGVAPLFRGAPPADSDPLPGTADPFFPQ